MTAFTRRTLVLAASLSLAILSTAQAQTPPVIRVGVTSGPHAEIVEALVPVAKAKGLTVKVIEFSDGAMINTATHEGEIEANAFQHTPYLDGQVKDRRLDLVSVARTVLLPMAAYSKRYKTLAELPNGAEVAIPNDPTNAGRALKLLETGGLLSFKPGLGFNTSVLDIVTNPRKLKIRELEATQIPRSLEDVGLAVINTNYAIRAGLNPLKDSLLRENDLSDYFCLIAVRRKDAEQPWVKVLVEAYRSPEVRKFVEDKYQGNILAGW